MCLCISLAVHLNYMDSYQPYILSSKRTEAVSIPASYFTVSIYTYIGFMHMCVCIYINRN